MNFAPIRVSEYFTFARQIFHSEAISLARRANFVEKSTHLSSRQMRAFFWWGMVDSDHRSQWQQIYSLPPLAAREIPQISVPLLRNRLELVNGVEPSTCWLQISCSAIEPHQRFTCCSAERYRLYHIRFRLSSLFLIFLKKILINFLKIKNNKLSKKSWQKEGNRV